MTTAVATILEDVRERFHPQIEPPRLCLIVDEISKVNDDRVRDLMLSTLYQVLDENVHSYSLAMTSLDYHPFMTSSFRQSGRETYPVYMGPLDDVASTQLLSEVIKAANVQLVFKTEATAATMKDTDSRAAAYLNAYLFGHCRSYEWCASALHQLRCGGKTSVSLLEIVNDLDTFIATENYLQVLTPLELALGLLYQSVP